MSIPRGLRRRWLFLLAAFFFASIWLGSAWHILARPVTPFALTAKLATALTAASDYPNCRFGVGGPVAAYSMTQLNVGWHMNWRTALTPTQPNGAEYVQVVRLKYYSGMVIFDPPTSTLYAIIDQNPGALWLIGNEPDSPAQDNLRPEDYAKGYQQVYTLIKTRDPSARTGAGSIVQPTPLRMQYLDRVLQAYQQLYQRPLPVDVWSIHTYILREISYDDPEACVTVDPDTGQCQPGPLSVWGADIPPGITATRGILYELSDTVRASIFQQRLIEFRQWMRDRGYQQTPLYITEYGTLFPYPPYSISAGEVFTYYDEFGQPITEARTALFMTETFKILQNLSSSTTGYPADNNHLVQRWLWYSVDDTQYGGLLFNPISHSRRPLGDVFAAYTAAVSPAVDLLAVRAQAAPVMLPISQTEVTGTLQVQIANVGNISLTGPLTVAFYEGPIGQPGNLLSTYSLSVGSWPGCAATRLFTATWPGLSKGLHLFHVQVEAQLPESNLDNNQIEGMILVADRQVWLPVVMRQIN